VRRAKGEVTTYGLGSAAVTTDGFQLDAGGLSFTVRAPVGVIDIKSKLVGRPHVYNILAAVAASLALGFDLRTIARGIAECENVPGRFERVSINSSQPGEFSVIVDYAHTDDALKKVLETAREVAGEGGRVIVVFGCGGDRDRTKRAPMGEIAAMGSDEVIVTSDNPRSEDPEAIISDIEAGLIKSQRPYLKLTDRREAIFRAIGDAREGDVVLIAGKGHETYQIIGNTTAHFDDREVAREAMAATASQ
jgi:UDP-N-acetylmuramoyl-L-alanyl-D-glutamate--2,6-diaminopimelate ligase